RRFAEGDRVVAANSAPCGDCRLCLAGRPNLCEDLLFVNGAYGEFLALPPRLVAKNVVPLARSLPAARAAFAEPLACALLGIERARVESGQTVVIFGAGPLGCLLGLCAAARKARVLLVGKAGWRLERVRELGIGECLDASATDDVVGEVRTRTGGHGADGPADGARGRAPGAPRARHAGVGVRQRADLREGHLRPLVRGRLRRAVQPRGPPRAERRRVLQPGDPRGAPALRPLRWGRPAPGRAR